MEVDYVILNKGLAAMERHLDHCFKILKNFDVELKLLLPNTVEVVNKLANFLEQVECSKRAKLAPLSTMADVRLRLISTIECNEISRKVEEVENLM